MGIFFLERGANLESRAAHTHPKNTQVHPRAFIQDFIASHMGLETLCGYAEIERAHRTPTQLNKNRK